MFGNKDAFFFCCRIDKVDVKIHVNYFRGWKMFDTQMNLDTHCLLSLNETQKIAFLRAFSKMASVDGSFDECEKEFIQNAGIHMGISREKTKDILNHFNNEEILKEVATITNRRAALELIKELCVLAHADEKLTDKEVLFIGKVGEAMGIEPEKIEQISNWVIDRLIWLNQGKIIFEEA